ncbi:MAG: flavodoxin family protein, partial [Candidatus Heimdallarchaeota archaeon]
MSRILIVYYSLTGHTKFIAETIKAAINADILALKPVKELKSDSSMKYMWGGAQATMKKKPKLEEFSIDPLAYDLIFLGTPVWAWTFTPPIRSFLS